MPTLDELLAKIRAAQGTENNFCFTSPGETPGNETTWKSVIAASWRIDRDSVAGLFDVYYRTILGQVANVEGGDTYDRLFLFQDHMLKVTTLTDVRVVCTMNILDSGYILATEVRLFAQRVSERTYDTIHEFNRLAKPLLRYT